MVSVEPREIAGRPRRLRRAHPARGHGHLPPDHRLSGRQGARRRGRLGEGRPAAGPDGRHPPARPARPAGRAGRAAEGHRRPAPTTEAARVQGPGQPGLLAEEQIDQRAASPPRRPSARLQRPGRRRARDADPRGAHDRARAGMPAWSSSATSASATYAGGATTPWFRIAKDGQVELDADVARGRSSTRCDPGVPGQGDPGRRRHGRRRRCGWSARGSTPPPSSARCGSALPVRADIRAGGFASGDFPRLHRARRWRVPETAVRYDADGASVMVVGADDRVARVPVTHRPARRRLCRAADRPAGRGSRWSPRRRRMLLPGDYRAAGRRRHADEPPAMSDGRPSSCASRPGRSATRCRWRCCSSPR